jgi:hypothetical protein
VVLYRGNGNGYHAGVYALLATGGWTVGGAPPNYNWSLILPGASWNFRGVYDLFLGYQAGDIVTYLGQTFYRTSVPGLANPGSLDDVGQWVLLSAKGAKGDKGDQGEIGPGGGDKGDKGDKGDTGDTGPQGLTGPEGAQGVKGDTGDQGIPGEKGDKGDTGISTSLFEYIAQVPETSSNMPSEFPSGKLRWNTVGQVDCADIRFSIYDRFGRDIKRIYDLIPIGSELTIQRQTDGADFQNFLVNSVIPYSNGRVEIGVTFVNGGGQGLTGFTNGTILYVLIGYSGPPGPKGDTGEQGIQGIQGIQGVKGDTGDTGLTGPQGIQGPAGTNGTNGTDGSAATIAVGTVTTGNAGTSAAVTNAGTSSAATFNFTIPRGETGATGATGPTGSSVELEHTFAQFSYYGTVPTASLLNMASGAVVNIGGSLGVGTNTGINQLTKTYHARSNSTTPANGAQSGWVAASTFMPFFVGQGFKVTYSFGLLDTSTNAGTRTIIGIGNFNAAVVLNSSTTVASLTNQFLGIIQESGENFFSFYTRGTGTTTPTVSTVTCTTPNTGWYTVTFHNDVNSSNVTITLKYVVGGVVTTATQTYLCGGANTLATSQACYPILQRSMTAAITGAAILGINGLKFYTR